MPPAILGPSAAGGSAGAILAYATRALVSSQQEVHWPRPDSTYYTLSTAEIIYEYPVVGLLIVTSFVLGLTCGCCAGPLVDLLFAARCAWGRAALALSTAARGPREQAGPPELVVLPTARPRAARPATLPQQGYRFVGHEE